MHVPASRLRVLNDAPVAPRADYVLYWMVAARRPRFNFALEQAAGYARALDRPLVVLEALRLGYPWASARLHAFVLEGMADNAAHFAKRRVRYLPFVEPRRGAGAGLLEALARHACLIVTDDYPCFFLPRMVAAAAAKLPVRVEAVDGNGLLPLALAEGKTFYNAYHFRRFVQRHVGRELTQTPREDPLARLALPTLAALPERIGERWPMLSSEALADVRGLVTSLAVSSAVSPVAHVQGGSQSARRTLGAFVGARLARYHLERNHPDAQVASGLSAYLHFGHLGVHEIIASLRAPEQWDGLPRGLAKSGERTGFWGLSPAAEAFLEEVVTFRELAFNTAATLPDFDCYETLPAWARATLEAHASDARPHVYTLEQLECAQTHDALWNAAQSQLRSEGRIHNYLRMLWGKQILAYSTSPRRALETMIALNNKYALDGRDPNSYAGIFWVLGRYDRPWAPERAVFGTVRYMSSGASMRKLRLQNYLTQHGGARAVARKRGAPKKKTGEE